MSRPSRRSHSTVAGRERSASFGAGGPLASFSAVFAAFGAAGAVAAMSCLLVDLRCAPKGMTIEMEGARAMVLPFAGHMGAGTTKLVAKDVAVEYWLARSERLFTAVDGVDLEIHDGEFVDIVGPSGCGKTKVLNAVDGLIPICGGSLTLDGREITKPGRDRAMVFQQPGLLPWRTVLGNIIFGVEAQGT